MLRNKIILLILSCLIFLSCGKEEKPAANKELEIKMNSIAEAYVKLILGIGQYDPDYVDAYYGPEEWKKEIASKFKSDSLSLDYLNAEANNLLDELELLSSFKANEIETLRYRYLYKQLLAAKTKIFMLSGGTLSFDEEAKSLYDAEVPVHSEEYFQTILNELNNLLPGNGTLAERLEDFKKEFIIPKEKIDTVFMAAIAECRKKTLQHIALPKGESFTVEYVTGEPWGAYNWYKGNSYSLIQVNTDLPIYIDRAVDLAAHEGYPGHHVYNALLEKNLMKERGWIEFSIYALFSPQSLIAEGTANYGIEMAFPGESRIKFEKEVLFPLAGLNPQKADKYYEVLKLTSKLNYAGNEAARNYLDGKWNKEETLNWLIKYSLMTKERAERYLKFIEKYRSYVINYNLGKDIVAAYIERSSGTVKNVERRWKLFEKLLSTPQTPSGLKK
jgi:hypothetical protein